MYAVYVCLCVCARLLGIHAQSLYWLDLGCGTAAALALSGCQIWSFTDNILKSLKNAGVHFVANLQQIQ